MASSFDMVDRALDGQLETRLRRMRAMGFTIKQMTETVEAWGYPVSRETVRRWCKRAGVPTHQVPAA